MLDILDPTIPPPPQDRIAYVARPHSLKGLRIGIVENTTPNSEAVLLRLAEKLEAVYDMKAEVLIHKHQRAALKDIQVAELKGKVDFVITGVGG